MQIARFSRKVSNKFGMGRGPPERQLKSVPLPRVIFNQFTP